MYETRHITFSTTSHTSRIASCFDRLHHLVVSILLAVQTQVPRHQATVSAPLNSCLGIHNAISPLRRLHQFGVLFFEDFEVALRFPVPDGVGGEDEVHFLEGTLVGFGVEGPDDEDGGDVDGAEEVEGLFFKFGEDCREEEDLVLRQRPFV